MEEEFECGDDNFEALMIRSLPKFMCLDCIAALPFLVQAPRFAIPLEDNILVDSNVNHRQALNFHYPDRRSVVMLVTALDSTPSLCVLQHTHWSIRISSLFKRVPLLQLCS